MKRALAIAVLFSGCGELGLTVDVSAKSDVPPLDELRLEVVQGPLLVEQKFRLGDVALPQSIAIVSKGLTRGTIEITVQGLAEGRIEATAQVSGELKPATGALRVSAVLERLCPVGSPTCGCMPQACAAAPKGCGLVSDGCGGQHDCGACAGSERCEGGTCQPAVCVPKSCAELGASCGFALDGCGQTLDCGQCDAGLNCGGSGVANSCGPGTCVPRTSCDAGMECDSILNGCGGLVSCGACDAGTCGADGMPFRCPCIPATRCPPPKQCGMWPNGCGTGNVDCGTCTLPQTCAGGGQPNVCGCTPTMVCPPLACGVQPNGCGGAINCPGSCPSGRSCTSLDGGPARCNCTSGLTECNGMCVNLKTSATNCGACGRSCPGGQSCWGGVCPCVDAGSNADGHCCPPGWFLSAQLELPNVFCYRGPFDAGTEAEGLAQCRLETGASYGLAVSALGSIRQNQAAAAAPASACGTFLRGRNNQVIDAVTGGMFVGPAVCTMPCTGIGCVCTTCTCAGAGRACAQKYYCVMDPLAPRVEGPCGSGSQCPPGADCQAGNCVDAGRRFCVTDGDCGLQTCADRSAGGVDITGLCQ